MIFMFFCYRFIAVFFTLRILKKTVRPDRSDSVVEGNEYLIRLKTNGVRILQLRFVLQNFDQHERFLLFIAQPVMAGIASYFVKTTKDRLCEA